MSITLPIAAAFLLAPATPPATAATPLLLTLQDEEDAPPEIVTESQGNRWDTRLTVDVEGGYRKFFRTSIDNGNGEVQKNEAWFGVSLSQQFTDDLGVTVRATYGLTDYEFDGVVTSFGASIEPWDNLQTLSLGAAFRFTGIHNCSIIGGPVLRVAREDGAELEDALYGGGFVAASWRVSDTLTIGGGIGVMDQIEDEIRINPIIILDWELTEELSLRSRSDPAPYGGNGLELHWDWSRDFDIAFGGAYERDRFRTDDTGFNPGGAIEEERIQMYVRGEWQLAYGGTLEVFAGWVVDGEFKADDFSGNRIAREDYDPVGTLGLNLSYRF